MNLGPTSARWLSTAGIRTPEALRRLGPIEAYLSVQASGCRPGLNLLYAIAGALDGVHWTKVDRTLLQVTLDQRQHSLPLLD